MNLINKNGITVSMTDETFIEFINKLPVDMQLKIVNEILDIDKNDFLKRLAKQRYKHCMDSAKQFKEMSEDDTFKKIGVGDDYLVVSNEYLDDAKKWKQFF